jgi:cytochrome oxidase assembly protein ShyY1
MSVFVGCFFPLVIGLGLWQLDRAAQKRELETAYMIRLMELPRRPSRALLADLSEGSLPFTRLRLDGEFNTEVFFIDNQVAQGKVGYWVVQGYVSDIGKFLVNRGFVPAEATRDRLPALSTPAGRQSIVGVVWPFTGLLPVYDDDRWAAGWPKRIQRLDIERMAQVLDAYGFEVRLEAGQAGVERAAPFSNTLNVDRHLGYAATWFGLALALIVLFVVYGRWKANSAVNEK